MPSDQSRIIEEAKFTYSPLGKGFEKQTKAIKGKRKKQKQIEAITNQNKRVGALTDKDNHKSDHKKTPEKIVEEKLSKIEELTVQVNYDDLIYCFKNNTVSKSFTDFENGVELLDKIKFGEMKLVDAKELQNIFKSSKISKGIFKSEDHKSALKILKHFTNHEKKLSICLMIILQLYLKKNKKWNMEKDWKY